VGGTSGTGTRLASGVASGLVLLGFGLFVVEAWVEEFETRRWRRVALIAFKALATGAVRMSTDDLAARIERLALARSRRQNPPVD
jgi:hypothetical protein